MTDSAKRHESPQLPLDTPPAEARVQDTAKSDVPPSPTSSDKSSESEGRPVREKLKETRIDAQASSDRGLSSDMPMNDIPNGANVTTHAGDQSASGSESERGRLPRKRSLDDLEEAEKQPEKHERHVRKRSRDITSPPPVGTEVLAKAPKLPVSRIDENDGDERMQVSAASQSSTSDRGPTPQGVANDNITSAAASPNNKRSRDQVENGNASVAGPSETSSTEKEAAIKEPGVKKTKGSETSGFANASTASPFGSIAQKAQPASEASATTTESTKPTSQTSEEKFKQSGFSSFSSSGSGFGALGNSTTASPFGSGASKLSSFASPQKSSTSTSSGFASLSSGSGQTAFAAAPSGTKSGFGGGFGGGGFGALAGGKSGLSTFATPGKSGITGLSKESSRVFGAQKEKEDSAEEGSGDEDAEATDDSEKEKDKDKQDKRFQLQEVETGEEGETTVWSSRAKLYTMSGEGKSKGWHERGAGPFRLNVTKDEPLKARFILRADGTHRLLLNAAVNKHMRFGDASGAEPTSGQVYFSAPNASGEIEVHTLKMKHDKAVGLFHQVEQLKSNL